jgi:hypothetical protein
MVVGGGTKEVEHIKYYRGVEVSYNTITICYGKMK